MRQRDILIAENGTARTTVRLQRMMIGILTVLFALSMLLNAAFGEAIMYRFPIKQWLWTTDAETVCGATNLAEPSITAARVKGFATAAAIDLNSYDYLNWARLLTAAMDRYMDPAGKIAFKEELATSGMIKNVESRNISLTSVPFKRVNLGTEGLTKDGRYFWVVEVPLRLWYHSPTASGDVMENRLYTVTVVRVTPSTTNPNGVAVDAISGNQMTAEQAKED